MRVVIFTPIRLLGDGLARYLEGKQNISIVKITDNMEELRAILSNNQIDVILIDVTQPIDLDDVRSIAVSASGVAIIALGLQEQRQDVIRCGRAGFSGYVPREASVDVVAKVMDDAVAGRLACPAEISNGLLRALFRAEAPAERHRNEAALTKREGDVLRLIGQGMTNKEIARELKLSVATVKHHVHNLLKKMNLPRRAQAMRRVRERPWIA
jgi:DNA-binding NarL/FixJ family response regulator